MSAAASGIINTDGRAVERPVGAGLARWWIIVIFSNLPIYIGLFVWPAAIPLYWIAILFAMTFVTLLGADRAAADRSPVFVGVLTCYACMCLIWYVGAGGGDPVVLRERILSIVLCLVSYLVFTASPAALRAARRVLVPMVVFAVVVDLWDITHPYMLIPSSSELATVGRGAGFFINPNQAGAALVAGFALSVGVLPRRWRLPYLAVVTGGVVLTFSRAALLGLVLVCMALASGGRSLTWRQLGGAFVLVVVLAVLTWLLVAAELREQFHIDPEVSMDRILWIFDTAGRADYSQEERIALLERGWEQFLYSPLVGNGVGSTELWEERTSTHNMYAMLASDFGVLGLFVFPVIVLAAMGAGIRRLTDATVTGLFLLFWGVFSHNVLSEYYLLISLSLLAALNRREMASSRALVSQSATGLRAS